MGTEGDCKTAHDNFIKDDIIPWRESIPNLFEKPICFRKKNPTLYFMSINLNHFGMALENVDFFSTQNKETCLMERKGFNESNFQIFKTSLPNMVVGNCTFSFRIFISGSLKSMADPFKCANSYTYELSDRLLKSQLWAVVSLGGHWTDVEIVAKDKTSL